MRLLLALAGVVMAGGAARADALTSFHTPSKNIYCIAVESAEGAMVDCEILAMAKIAPVMPRPADCDLEWGHRFDLGEAGFGYLACTGDTLRDDTGQTLAYGTSFKVGGITCASSQNGLECRNGEKHGFFLSKGRQRVF